METDGAIARTMCNKRKFTLELPALGYDALVCISTLIRL